MNRDCQLIFEAYKANKLSKFDPTTIKIVGIGISRGGYDIDDRVYYQQDFDHAVKMIQQENPEFEVKTTLCLGAVKLELPDNGEGGTLILSNKCDIWYCIEDITNQTVSDKADIEFVDHPNGFLYTGKIGPHLQTCIMVRKKFDKNTPEDQQTAADLLDI